jgi:O-antigen ligase/polysaccharide polymerase Wzy-like membrane protein/tetratricopeptide repeat protein
VSRIPSFRPPALAEERPVVVWEANGDRLDRPDASPARGFFLLVVLCEAALFGVSGLFGGFYDFATWGVLALAFSVLLVSLILTRPLNVAAPAAAALAGVGLLVLWSALSMTWAQSVDQAWNEVNRFGFYGITLALVVGAVRTRRHAAAVMGVLTAGLALTAVYTMGDMLIGAGGSMFREFRLEDPLGYINGEAGLALMSFWAFLAVAEAARNPVLRGAALGLTVLAGDLMVLTQSRAGIPALGVSVLFMLVFLPGRTVRGWALVVAAVGVAASLPPVLDVYAARDGGGTLPSDATVRGAALAGCLAAVGAGALWGLACGLLSRVWRPWLRKVSAGALLTIALAGAGLALVAVDRPFERISSEYKAFVSLDVDESGSSRFGSGGGFRYDLWRISWRQFADSPLKGVGAGNYDTTYYRERRNPQPAPQPHSLEMQVLGELGVVGALGLLLFVGGVLWAIFRGERAPPRLDRWVVVASAGIFVAWLAHTSVDWLHNIAGLTGIALVAAGVLLAGPEATGSKRTWRGRGSVRAAVAVVGVTVLALLAASEGRRYAADRYLERADSKLGSNPSGALSEADKALDLNPESLPAHYAAAGAYARLGRYELARATLRQATRKEPSDYVPWVLLGDLAVRHGDVARARADYRRATALSPYDTNFSVSESEERLKER